MFRKLLENHVSSKSLGFFRILYCLVLLNEVLRLYFFRHLIFDKIPYFEISVISFDRIFIVWMFVISLLIFGYQTRFAAIANYFLSLFLIGTIHHYEYHMFYTYMGVNLFLIFLPISSSYSIDSLIKRLKNTSTNDLKSREEQIPELYYYILVFFGVGLVYLDSISFKVTSPMWMNGLGMWLPASVPFGVNVNASSLLNMEYVMKFLGYLTIVFEFLFIFLFWNKRFKFVFFLIGIGLHVGIYILFPIPQFAQGVMCVYLLLLPFTYPEKIKLPRIKSEFYVVIDDKSRSSRRFKVLFNSLDLFKRINYLSLNEALIKNPKLQTLNKENLAINGDEIYVGAQTFINTLKTCLYLYPIGLFLQIPGINRIFSSYYERRWNENNMIVDAEINQNCESVFKNRLIRRRGLFLYFIYFLMFLQLVVTLRSPLIYNYFSRFTIYNSFIENTKFIKRYSQRFFGITNHGVFTDGHFVGYNHIVKVEYIDTNGKLIRLPIIDNDGCPDEYLKNFTWVNWTFGVMGRNVDQKKLTKGIRDYTAFWLHNSEIIKNPDGEFRFVISCKKVDYTTEYQENFLNKQIEKPWIEIGKAQWNNGQFQISVLDIEKEIK